MAFDAGESLAARIAGYLTTEIVRGHMISGERIQEARVVNALQVSRGSVREALLLLEKCHLVTILPRRGAFVAELTPLRVRSIYDLYVTLLTMLAEKLAQNWQTERAQPLLQQAAETARLSSAEDHHAFIEAGFETMNRALELADNEYLSTVMRDLQPALYRTVALALRQADGESGFAGQVITDLINAAMHHQYDKIRDLVAAYGQRQCELVLTALQAQPMAERDSRV